METRSSRPDMSAKLAILLQNLKGKDGGGRNTGGSMRRGDNGAHTVYAVHGGLGQSEGSSLRPPQGEPLPTRQPHTCLQVSVAAQGVPAAALDRGGAVMYTAHGGLSQLARPALGLAQGDLHPATLPQLPVPVAAQGVSTVRQLLPESHSCFAQTQEERGARHLPQPHPLHLPSAQPPVPVAQELSRGPTAVDGCAQQLRPTQMEEREAQHLPQPLPLSSAQPSAPLGARSVLLGAGSALLGPASVPVGPGSGLLGSDSTLAVRQVQLDEHNSQAGEAHEGSRTHPPQHASPATVEFPLAALGTGQTLSAKGSGQIQSAMAQCYGARSRDEDVLAAAGAPASGLAVDPFLEPWLGDPTPTAHPDDIWAALPSMGDSSLDSLLALLQPLPGEGGEPQELAECAAGDGGDEGQGAEAPGSDVPRKDAPWAMQNARTLGSGHAGMVGVTTRLPVEAFLQETATTPPPPSLLAASGRNSSWGLEDSGSQNALSAEGLGAMASQGAHRRALAPHSGGPHLAGATTPAMAPPVPVPASNPSSQGVGRGQPIQRASGALGPGNGLPDSAASGRVLGGGAPRRAHGGASARGAPMVSAAAPLQMEPHVSGNSRGAFEGMAARGPHFASATEGHCVAGPAASLLREPRVDRETSGALGAGDALGSLLASFLDAAAAPWAPLPGAADSAFGAPEGRHQRGAHPECHGLRGGPCGCGECTSGTPSASQGLQRGVRQAHLPHLFGTPQALSTEVAGLGTGGGALGTGAGAQSTRSHGGQDPALCPPSPKAAAGQPTDCRSPRAQGASQGAEAVWREPMQVQLGGTCRLVQHSVHPGHSERARHSNANAGGERYSAHADERPSSARADMRSSGRRSGEPQDACADTNPGRPGSANYGAIRGVPDDQVLVRGQSSARSGHLGSASCGPAGGVLDVGAPAKGIGSARLGWPGGVPDDQVRRAIGSASSLQAGGVSDDQVLRGIGNASSLQAGGVPAFGALVQRIGSSSFGQPEGWKGGAEEEDAVVSGSKRRRKVRVLEGLFARRRAADGTFSPARPPRKLAMPSSSVAMLAPVTRRLQYLEMAHRIMLLGQALASAEMVRAITNKGITS